MLKFELPYPEEVFPWVIYSSNWRKAFSRQWEIPNIPYDAIFRDAWVYIENFQTSDNLPFDVNKYNFSMFQANNLTDINSMHHWYIRFLTETVNTILGLPRETQVSTLPQFKNKKKVDHELWLLWVEIYPDTEYMISLNYEDFAVGFLGFSVTQDWNIDIVQLQSWKIVDETQTFSQKHHYLDWFEWTKVLVSFFEDYLKKKWFTWKIIIQCSENNWKFKEDNQLSDDPETRAKQIRINDWLLKNYNPTAQALWYDRNSRNWSSRSSDYLDYSKTI